MDLRLPEANQFSEALVRAGQLLRKTQTRIVVSHEEPAVLPAAKIFGLPTVFLIHWFSAARQIFMQALQYADDILFMERQGIFQEPSYIKDRIRYVGPVLREFQYRPKDRNRARDELGFHPDEKVILMLPGSFSEERAPCCDLVFRAFQLVKIHRKRLIWLAGVDREQIARYGIDCGDIDIIEADAQIDRLMIASDLALTKGTYNISNELAALGIPSISLSHRLNFADDTFCRLIPTNTFVWAMETEPSSLADHIEAALDRGLATPDILALDGSGAATVAAFLAHALTRARTED